MLAVKPVLKNKRQRRKRREFIGGMSYLQIP